MPRPERGRRRWLRCSGRAICCAGDRLLRATGGCGITIWVRGGDYLLPGGLHFGAEDGGTPEAPVTWRAWPGERVRLVGGVPVARFEPWRGEILQAERDRYELRADSPAFALGFAPIPVDRIPAGGRRAPPR